MPTFSKASVSTWTSEKGEAVPYSRTPVPAQVSQVSEDGSRQSHDFGHTVYLIPLTFRNISVSNYDDLVTFFSDALVNWSANSFTYTDYAGSTHTVTLEPLSLSGNLTANRYTVSMLLREVT